MKPGKRQWLADNSVPLILAGIAFGGSFTHWVRLAADHGQSGLLSVSVAVSVDLGIYMATRERQRDARTGRSRRGLLSWPTLVLVGGIVLTLAGNVASAQLSGWGVATALIPGVFLLIAISFMERRAAEEGRRLLAAEAEAARQAAAERQRQASLAAEAERQRQAALDAAAKQQRQAERRSELAARQAAIVNPGVTPASTAVTPGPGSGVLPGPTAGGAGKPVLGAAEPASVTATEVMWAYWAAERAEGRTPSGADLARAAGLDPASSSLGRQRRTQWLREERSGGVAEGPVSGPAGPGGERGSARGELAGAELAGARS